MFRRFDIHACFGVYVSSVQLCTWGHRTSNTGTSTHPRLRRVPWDQSAQTTTRDAGNIANEHPLALRIYNYKRKNCSLLLKKLYLKTVRCYNRDYIRRIIKLSLYSSCLMIALTGVKL